MSNLALTPQTHFALELREVDFQYGKFRALNSVDLELPYGSITAIVGPNGAGKSTLLNLIVGLLRSNSGQIKVCGENPSNTSHFLSRIGFVGQDCPLYDDFTVRDTLHLGQSLNPAWNQELALNRLREIEIPLDRRIGKLSGGQRAQVALTLAVAKLPQILVLDEPLASLDPVARRDFLKSLVEIVASTGMTVLLSSHLIGDLSKICDHIAIIRNGEVALSGEIDHLLSGHLWLSGASAEIERVPHDVHVISNEIFERHRRVLVRTMRQILNPSLTILPVDLEELVLAYLESPHIGESLREKTGKSS